MKKISRLRDDGESGRMTSHFDGAMMDGRERYCRQDNARRTVFTSDVAEAAGVCSSAGDCQSRVALSLHTSVPWRRRRRRFILDFFELASVPVCTFSVAMSVRVYTMPSFPCFVLKFANETGIRISVFVRMFENETTKDGIYTDRYRGRCLCNYRATFIETSGFAMVAWC